MSADRRFSAMGADNGIVKFKIDTTKILIGATDGSENPLTFTIPLRFLINSSHKFIIRVSDGRADVPYTPDTPNNVLTFPTAGIYDITLIGSSGFFMGSAIDRLKMIEMNILEYPFSRSIPNIGFIDRSNLVFKFKETLKLSGNNKNYFKNTKGFSIDFDMSLIDVSSSTSLTGMFEGITLPIYSALNPFIAIVTSLVGLYENVDLSNLNKIEIIAPNLANVSNMLKSSQFRGDISIKAPLVKMYGFLSNVTNPPSLGKVDIRIADDFGGGWIGGNMTTENINSTLKGWVNNFNWDSTPVILRTVNFRDSIYSNNAEVIAAKSFLESKGFTFTNLTMAT